MSGWLITHLVSDHYVSYTVNNSVYMYTARAYLAVAGLWCRWQAGVHHIPGAV